MLYVLKRDLKDVNMNNIGVFKVVEKVRDITVGDMAIELFNIDNSYTERLDLFGGAKYEPVGNE